MQVVRRRASASLSGNWYQSIVPEFGIRSVANDLEEMAAQFGAFYLVDVGVADVVGLGRFDAVRAAVVAAAVLRNLDAFLQRLGPDLGELPGHANAAGVVLVVVMDAGSSAGFE